MLSYHGDDAIKAKYLARVRAHREGDAKAVVMVEGDDERAYVEIEAGGLTVSLFVHPQGCARLGALLTRAARALGVAP